MRVDVCAATASGLQLSMVGVRQWLRPPVAHKYVDEKMVGWLGEIPRWVGSE